MADLRNKLAKCRDEWMLSHEGGECQDGITSGQYLRNRLERAFVAGWHARDNQQPTHGRRLHESVQLNVPEPPPPADVGDIIF